MAQPVVTRSQRRLESKQYVTIVVLILVVAGVSFYLGVQFGKNGGAMAGFADNSDKPKLPIVTQVKPPPMPVEKAEEKPEKLTFYDNLPKGKQAPLGSGINLPPKERETGKKVQEKAAEKVKVVSPSIKAKPKIESAPPSSSEGVFVVQVASFRTSEDAKKLSDRLKTYKLTAYVETADLGEKGVWHRVLSGPFETRENADSAARLLREKERLSALVRKR